MDNKQIPVTKEEFLAYVKVQESGMTNMFDITNVQLIAAQEDIADTYLSEEVIKAIMNDYGELYEKYVEGS